MIPTNCPLGSNWSTTIYIMKRANIHPQSNTTLEMPQIQLAESGAFCPILQRPSSYVIIVALLPSFFFSKLGMSFWFRIFLEKFISQDHFRLNSICIVRNPLHMPGTVFWAPETFEPCGTLSIGCFPLLCSIHFLCLHQLSTILIYNNISYTMNFIFRS